MFLSMNWISDFVDLSGLDKMELIKQFSLSTAEVENDIYKKGEDLEGVVVAKEQIRRFHVLHGYTVDLAAVQQEHGEAQKPYDGPQEPLYRDGVFLHVKPFDILQGEIVGHRYWFVLPNIVKVG